MIIVGAKYISQLLNVTHTLQELYIDHNYNIGDDGIAVISEALQHNKSFTILWIQECGLSAKGTMQGCAHSGRQWSVLTTTQKK